MFCRYCGKEVPEGQSCSCPGAQAAQRPQQPYQQPQQPYQQPYQQPRQAAPAGSDVGKVVGDAFKSAPNAAKSLLTDPTGSGVGLPVALVFLGAALVVYVLGCLMLVSGILGPAKELMKMAGISFTGSTIWLGFLIWLFSALVPFLIVLLLQVIKKEPANWQQALSTAGCVMVAPAVAFFLGCLLTLISTQIGAIFILMAVVIAATLNGKMILKAMKTPDSMAALVITSVILSLIITLSGFVVYKVVEGAIVSLAGGALGGLGGLMG